MDLHRFRALTDQVDTEQALMPPTPESIQAMSVKQLNEHIRQLFEKDVLLENVCVYGEISNFTAHRSGHYYFSVKDADSIIRTVMFSSSVRKTTFLPKDGMRVIVRGSVSVYIPNGQYQLYATSILPDGIGSLYIEFEERKRKLAAEGLFALDRKKKLPRIPTCIGVITSPTGAAVQDVIRVLGRRFPFAKILIYPALVQGVTAPMQLMAGIRYFNESGQADVIILGRGGGSMEDLFAFNDEGLARCIAASQIPIISAVGHETDFTICDFVADMRAPTPSAAAEIAVPETQDIQKQILNFEYKLRQLLKNVAIHKRQQLHFWESRQPLRKPTSMLSERQMQVVLKEEYLVTAMKNRMQAERSRFREMTAKLQSLSPLSVLSRGFCAAYDRQNAPLCKIKHMQAGDAIRLRFIDGYVDGTVNDILPI